MTKAKKALCLALTVVMVIGVFAFSALAADQTATFTVTASETQIEVGDTITVTVMAETDYYAAATGMPIYYDEAVFDYVAGSLQVVEVFGTGGATSVFDNAAEPAGLLNVVIVPLDSYGAVSRHLSGTLLTFQLTAKAEGTSEIGLRAEDQKTESHIGGPLYCGAYASEDVTSAVTATGQTFILNNTTVTVGTAAEPELQLTEAGASAGGVISIAYGVSDGYTGVVMGLETLGYNMTDDMITLEDALTTPSGYIEIDTSKSGGAETTGAEIKLYSDDGELLETYVFIYFGDVNMDGLVSSSDATAIEEYEFYIADIAEEYRLLAADLNGDYFPSSADATMIEEYEFYIVDSLPSQSACAAVYA